MNDSIGPFSPEFHAAMTARAAAIAEKLDLHELSELATRAVNEPVPRQKVIWLRRLTNPLAKATQGNVACRVGCAHCCHIPVVISRIEAEVIAQETGRALATTVRYIEKASDDHLGTPCPFLKDSRCSIYSSRPIICRTHYNVDYDASKCMTDKPRDVPYLDHRQFTMTTARALVRVDSRHADIRDFFPS